jgi:hypothetical protein
VEAETFFETFSQRKKDMSKDRTGRNKKGATIKKSANGGVTFSYKTQTKNGTKHTTYVYPPKQ